MPSPEQIIRLTHVLGWIRTAKEALPAINQKQGGQKQGAQKQGAQKPDGQQPQEPSPVAAEQIARASALLDRMYRQAMTLSAAIGNPAAEGALPLTVDTPAARHGRRAA